MEVQLNRVLRFLLEEELVGVCRVKDGILKRDIDLGMRGCIEFGGSVVSWVLKFSEVSLDIGFYQC